MRARRRRVKTCRDFKRRVKTYCDFKRRINIHCGIKYRLNQSRARVEAAEKWRE